jgi:hypothetical protein
MSLSVLQKQYTWQPSNHQKRSTSVGDLLSKMKRKNGQMNKRTHVFNPKSINPEKMNKKVRRNFRQVEGQNRPTRSPLERVLRQ